MQLCSTLSSPDQWSGGKDESYHPEVRCILSTWQMHLKQHDWCTLNASECLSSCNVDTFRSLTVLSGKHPTRWDEHLQATMFALRTKKQLTTKFSRYYLMFGWEARYPSEVLVDYDVSGSIF